MTAKMVILNRSDFKDDKWDWVLQSLELDTREDWQEIEQVAMLVSSFTFEKA